MRLNTLVIKKSYVQSSESRLHAESSQSSESRLHAESSQSSESRLQAESSQSSESRLQAESSQSSESRLHQDIVHEVWQRFRLKAGLKTLIKFLNNLINRVLNKKIDRKIEICSESGFSLVEFLVVSVILVFTIGIIGGIVTGVQRSYTEHRPRTEALNDATATLDFLTRLIRTAGNNPNGIVGLKPIEPGTADGGIYKTIRIRSDWRGSTMSSLPDGDIGDPFEDVIFSTSNNTLMKKEPGDSIPQEFLNNVSSLQFVYYDTSNVMVSDPTTNHTQIARIDITIIISPPDTTPMTFSSSAFMRQR